MLEKKEKKKKKGLTKNPPKQKTPMAGGKLLFSRVNELLEKHVFCRLAHF